MPSLEIKSPTVGLLYNNLTRLTDDIYASEFTDERPSDAEIKYGDATGNIRDIDLRWLINKTLEENPHAKIATDPRERTHIYLNAVAEYFDEVLGDEVGKSCYLNRHELHRYFPNGEFIGTPLDYTEIKVIRHPEGYLLGYLGGGYAGNRFDRFRTSTGQKLRSSVKGIYLPDGRDTEELFKIPTTKIAKAVAEAGGILGIGDAENIEPELKYIAKPQPRRDVHTYDVRYIHVGGDMLPTHSEFTTELGSVALRLSYLTTTIEKECYSVKVEDPRSENGTREVIIQEIEPDPKCTLNPDGSATYVCHEEDEEERPEYVKAGIGLEFSLSIASKPEQLSLEKNRRVEEAIEHIREELG